jgi:hypothetical protein
MNASEMLSSVNPRFKRIQRVSRIAKWTGYVFCLYAIGFFVFATVYSPHLNLSLAYFVILCVWYWKLAGLFQLYERGQIFAAQTIRCIKTLGILWAAGWLLRTTAHFLSSPATITPVNPASGVTPVSVVKHSYKLGFFSCDFGTGVDFGGLLAASVIVLIAWIMDEGRKIQEERELTV